MIAHEPYRRETFCSIAKRVTLFIGILVCTSVVQAELPVSFRSAQPIWPKGKETEKNLFVGFRAVFQAPTNEHVLLRCAGATLYRVSLNGKFLAHGPARGPHGFYRVDEIDLTGRLLPGKNLIAFEVAGYNANSYYLLDQPSFLQAEIVAGGKVLASTAGQGENFRATILNTRVEKVQRYSFQRPFSEVYRLAPGCDNWKKTATAKVAETKCVVQETKALLPRRVPFCDFRLRQPLSVMDSGQVLKNDQPAKNPWKDRSLTGVGPKLGGYLEKDLETIPSLELQRCVSSGANKEAQASRAFTPETKLRLGSPKQANNSYTFDFGVNLTGFIGAKIICTNKTRLFFTFDEILSNGDVDWKRLGCVNVVTYELEPGEYDLESFEPYTLRYLKMFTLEGGCLVENVHLREYANDSVWQAQFAASNEQLNRLFDAARETFRQNAIDIFMDCPSRERAGWLCDSFFTSRVAADLCGNTRIEKNFLENFSLPKKFEHLPDGMLPMCYPADHNDGVFIPNWSLWFVVQLEEYLDRSADRELVEALRPRVLKLLEYFKQFRNSDGLLEKLQSWVFVEWSRANEFVQDVNFPSNMLYAKALAAAGKMYDLPELVQDAEKIRATIRQQSFDGEFFVDNAVRKNGKLEVTRNRSEVCQYFAFFFDVATPQSHPELWQKLSTRFGPKRKTTNVFPEIHRANAFVGNVLRLELLSRYGLAQQNLDESLAYLLYMADRTGTLWENDGAYASCNHGFASHEAQVLFRDVLGVAKIDQQQKKVQIHFADLNLDWCEGSLPTRDGRVSLRWRKDDRQLFYQLSAPAGYSVQIENASGRELHQQP